MRPGLPPVLWALALAVPAWALRRQPKPAAASLRAVSATAQLSHSEAEASARSLVARMGVQEKASLLHGSNAYQPGWYIGNTAPLLHHNMPALTMQDAGNGYRPTPVQARGTTVTWPSGLALAATWDERLVEEVAAEMGREFHEKGANVMLGPSVNVHRVSVNGRNFEYLSGEDPYLGARLVRPFVRGVQAQGVMCVVKHFAFNEQETNRGTGPGVVSDSQVDARTAWELYYPPFEAAVQEGVAGFMCSYNKVNGTHACENAELLSRDLKGAMGFRGFVMSDWGATHSGEKALLAGLDQDMPGGPDGLFGPELWSRRPEEADRAAERVVAQALRLGLNRKPGCLPPGCLERQLRDVRTPKAVRLARRAATRSIVLLKNKGVLPLDPTQVRTVAVFGIAAMAPPSQDPMGVLPDYFSGGGSGHVPVRAISPEVITPIAGIMERAFQDNVTVLFQADHDPAKAREMAEKADLVVVVAATTASEGMDRSSLNLDFGVDSLIHGVSSMRPTVVLAQVPGPVLTPWRDQVAGLAVMFLGGEQTGHAWASLLFGDDEPVGRLPVQFPAHFFQQVFPAPGPAVYSEKLQTSYRTIHKPAFGFGHGLSFTEFHYSPLQQVECWERACVNVTITNRGHRPGAELAQLYVNFTKEAGEPPLVLKGFRRSRQLAPGESQELKFELTDRDVSIWQGTWKPQAGCTVMVGASSQDIRSTVKLP